MKSGIAYTSKYSLFWRIEQWNLNSNLSLLRWFSNLSRLVLQTWMMIEVGKTSLIKLKIKHSKLRLEFQLHLLNMFSWKHELDSSEWVPSLRFTICHNTIELIINLFLDLYLWPMTPCDAAWHPCLCDTWQGKRGMILLHDSTCSSHTFYMNLILWKYSEVRSCTGLVQENSAGVKGKTSGS